MPTRKKLSPRDDVSQAQEHGTGSEHARAPLEKCSVSTAMNFAICRTQILEKYWELANLDPEVTKGNITGQLKALDSLCQGLDVVSPTEQQPNNTRDKENEIYRSAWMRPDKTAGGTDHK
jgi:hypothetical protein